MSVKVYNANSEEYWYVHISNYFGLRDVHGIFRGDSDPEVEFKGFRYNAYDLDDWLYEVFLDEKDEWEHTHDEPFFTDDFDTWAAENTDMIYFNLCISEPIKKRKHSKSKSTSTPHHTMLTDNEKRILSLIPKLKDHNDIVEQYQDCVVQEDWDAHHAANITLSDTIDDYQVLRVYDVEIDWTDPIEKATDEELKAIEDAQDKGNYYDGEWEELLMRLDKDGINPYHDYEIGEYQQYWLNVKTGEVVFLGKIFNDDPDYCDFEAEWEIIGESDERHIKFAHKFRNSFGSHYMDVAIHPLLIERGYTGMNACDWSYGCGEEEYRTDEANFFRNMKRQVGWLEFITNIAQGGEWERRLKMYGLHTYINMVSNIDIEIQDRYLKAVKIAKRNHYEPADKDMWRDMVKALIWLDKDVSNSFYVCPTDLHEAHDRWLKLYNRKKEEIEAKRMVELAKGRNEKYVERVGKYLDCKVSTDELDIFVCPSTMAMAEEGNAMHHCVYRMEYYKRETSLIVFVRDKWNARIATSEIRTNTWTIAQTRGMCNREPYFNGENYLAKINELITNELIPQLKQASKHITRIIPLNTNTAVAEQPTQVALAA